ncbi:MAG: hydrogenase expression/formation protein HypE [Cyanobacteriota bacterium]|nr:hydrogenase expression/formation protein HypE [Cyanobacteriota bacterium]
MSSGGERIQLGHGGGGTLMQELIAQEFLRLYPDPSAPLHDAARLQLPHGRLAFCSDGYVVQPLEFAGGDIGKLAVTGTANDLAMAGARPLHLSASFIFEEGLPLALLRRLVASMVAAAHDCGVTIVTGDTKVVERGKADGVFITTSGIGLVEADGPIDPGVITPGDQLLLSGDLGRHGLAILAARHGLDLQPPVASDCAPLWPQVEAILAAGAVPHCLRDLTRGGLGSALAELAAASGCDMVLDEAAVPLAPGVAASCQLLGLEPLHLANEGRFVAVVPAEQLAAAEAVLAPGGGRWVGAVQAAASPQPLVRLRTGLGSQRVLPPFSGEMLPRIC